MSASLRAALVTLRENVDRFMVQCLERHGDAMACQPGCATCCAADLTVFPVEAAPLFTAVQALPEELRAAVRERAEAGVHCALLVNERCVVYEERPVICRTQGLALLLDDGTVAACPLNFDDTPEAVPAEDQMSLPRLNLMLSMLHRSSLALVGHPDERVRLADIAGATFRP